MSPFSILFSNSSKAYSVCVWLLFKLRAVIADPAACTAFAVSTAVSL